MWAAGGACLSVIAGVQLWSSQPPAGTADPSGTSLLYMGIAGAIAGLIGAVRFHWRHGDGGKFFAVAYPAAIVWTVLVGERGYPTAVFVIAAWIAIVGAVAKAAKRFPAGPPEAWKLAAAIAWVLTVLMMPIFFLGLGVLPLAIALTAAARASNRTQPDITAAAASTAAQAAMQVVGGRDADRPRSGWLERAAFIITCVVAALAIGSAGVVVVSGADDPPEIPENAVINFVMSKQEGNEHKALGRVCAAKKDEYERGGAIAQVPAANAGYSGLSGWGWPSELIDDHTVIVYGSSGAAGPPVRPWFTPPQRVWAIEMRKEDRKWRVCDIRPTEHSEAGFDTRPPCFEGQISDPDDPNGCRKW